MHYGVETVVPSLDSVIRIQDVNVGVLHSSQFGMAITSSIPVPTILCIV